MTKNEKTTKKEATSVKNVPAEFFTDLLHVYCDNFESLQNIDNHKKANRWKKIAENWEEDRAYNDFDIKRICGPFLSACVTYMRSEFRKIYKLKRTGSGFEAAKTKCAYYEVAFATFTKEDEFAVESRETTIESKNELDVSSSIGDTITMKLTPKEKKRSRDEEKKDSIKKKAKLELSTLEMQASISKAGISICELGSCNLYRRQYKYLCSITDSRAKIEIGRAAVTFRRTADEESTSTKRIKLVNKLRIHLLIHSVFLSLPFVFCNRLFVRKCTL